MSQMNSPRLPFRKRRPVLFLVLVLLALLMALGAINLTVSALDKKGIFSGPRLGLVRIEGFIGNIASTVEWMDTLRRDPKIAGVLIRVDSSGGGVSPSQELYMAAKRLADTKPVVVSMGTVAASGGYYVAVAGQEIFANPSTITGSIGVRMQLTNVQELMHRVGVSSESLTTGKFKAAGSPFKEFSPEERAYLQGILQDMQDEFVTTVAAGRKMPMEAVIPLADGRIFTGRQALEAKLVDHLGDQQAAVTRLAALAREKGVALSDRIELVEAPPQKRSLIQKLFEAAVNLEAESAAKTSQYTFFY